MNHETMLLSQQDIESLVTMKDIVECVDKTFQGLGDGTVINPTKVLLNLGETVPWPPYEGFMNAMPAYLGWCDIAGIKWAGGFLAERKKAGLPYITSMILLLDPHLGEFQAAMDGAFITNMRTGAQTAVALKYMYRKGKSLRLGLYGAGMQGHTQTMAISELFDITELKVYDINRAAAEKFAEEMKGYVKGKIEVAATPEAASDADVCVFVTQSQDAFFQYSWFKPGMLLFPMGSYQECSDECILKADKLVVDHPGQALHRGALGKLGTAGKITEETLFGTIGELAAGKKQLSDADANDRILCVPIGTGCMDVGVAYLAWQRAKEKGVGSFFSFV
ncbi:MAG: ornithine cyclodeaminase family protein [Candidatus Accumulibacter sp.]|jgi:ornithine cyclodeaminase/alanine dehydrogenase|nr:ornithine cyclodeaminase family protein [Accumulibacter sp.]